MASWWRKAIGAASFGMAASATVVATSGIMVLARRFVEDLSRPGVSLDDLPEGVGWELPQGVPEPPTDCQRPVSFHAPGGPHLRGEFWAQLAPAPTIVICHGYRVDRARLRPVAALEYQQGFNVMLFDFRGHGESAHVATSGGNAEVRDLLAAIDVATHQPETLPGKLFIHGFSMGAAVALLTPPREDVAGIIADSPYAQLEEILCQLMTWQLTTESATWSPSVRWLRGGFPALSRVTFEASDVIFRLRYHHPLRARPDARIRAWGKQVRRRARQRAEVSGIGLAPRRVPILLIHALRDPFIPLDHAFRIALAARSSQVPLEMHFVDADVHCGAYGHDPERYIAALERFVRRALAERDAGIAPVVPGVAVTGAA